MFVEKGAAQPVFQSNGLQTIVWQAQAAIFLKAIRLQPQ
jgi:hypothetical protein